VADLHAVEELLRAIWQAEPGHAPIEANLLQALAHAGHYVAGGRLDGRLVGVAVAFACLPATGRPVALHSHIAGVDPGVQHRHIGFALKLHQRAWAMARGFDEVVWTFDPLVGRNAFFNLTRLGATVGEYHANFYGAMRDGINVGDETDRCVARWQLAGRRATAAAERQLPEPDGDALRAEGAVVLLDDDGGHPRPHPDLAADPAAALAAGLALVRVPADIVALRAADPKAATAWRRAVRDTLGVALDEGFVADGMTRSGWYVLRAGAGAGQQGPAGW